MSNQVKDYILITGAAGFIGAALAKKLLTKGYCVLGLDNINDYYDVTLKKDRLKQLEDTCLRLNIQEKWKFFKSDLNDNKNLEDIFSTYKPKTVINLAAQAGVRHSIEKPLDYINSNINGFFNILEMCRRFNTKHLIYASSSSVYGANEYLPFSEKHSVNHPISLYAATKKSNELMAHSYSHLYKFAATGLRFFTVYGPWGRPDMAPMIFSKAILNDQPINLFNNGNMRRDFTYIDDATEVIVSCFKKIPSPDKNFNRLEPDPSSSFAAHKILNVGNSKSVHLRDFLRLLEKALGKRAIINNKQMQPGDVKETLCDNSNLKEWIGFSPNTSIEHGVKEFADWYLKYYLRK